MSRNPRVTIGADEAATVERVLRMLATGESVSVAMDLRSQAERILCLKAWLRFEKFRTPPVNAVRRVEATSHSLVGKALAPSEDTVQ